MGGSNRPRLGRREREAGKRHKRGMVSFLTVAGWITLKLGHKKFRSYMFHRLSVADHEKPSYTAQGDSTASRIPSCNSNFRHVPARSEDGKDE